MSKQNNGGPAFPDLKATKVESNYGGVYVDKYEAIGGLSIRDYFAAKALGVMCSSNVNGTGTFASPGGRETVASVCYQMADAMLKARG